MSSLIFSSTDVDLPRGICYAYFLLRMCLLFLPATLSHDILAARFYCCSVPLHPCFIVAQCHCTHVSLLSYFIGVLCHDCHTSLVFKAMFHCWGVLVQPYIIALGTFTAMSHCCRVLLQSYLTGEQCCCCHTLSLLSAIAGILHYCYVPL